MCWTQGTVEGGFANGCVNPHSPALSPALGGRCRLQFRSAGERDANFLDPPPRVAVATFPNPYRYDALTGLKTDRDEAFRHPLCPARKDVGRDLPKGEKQGGWSILIRDDTSRLERTRQAS
jgi:hypothetical protein